MKMDNGKGKKVNSLLGILYFPIADEDSPVMEDENEVSSVRVCFVLCTKKEVKLILSSGKDPNRAQWECQSGQNA